MIKGGPNISDTTLSVLNLVMDLIIVVMLIFTFKPKVSSIKILIDDAVKKVNIKEIIFIVVCKSLIVVGGDKIVIDALYIFNENDITSFLYDMIIKISEPIQYLTNAVIFLILCPIIDELIFRNIIFKSISKKFSVGTGIMISSILFAALNTGNGIAGAFIFGIINCIIYIKYENIVMPILSSLACNIIVYISLIPFLGEKLRRVIYSSANIPVTLSISFLMFFIGVVLFLKFFAKNKKYISDYNNELKGDSESYSI